MSSKTSPCWRLGLLSMLSLLGHSCCNKPLTIASYKAPELITAYVEPVGVGDLLPSLPIFLDARTHVAAPLEATYPETWNPSVVKELFES